MRLRVDAGAKRDASEWRRVFNRTRGASCRQKWQQTKQGAEWEHGNLEAHAWFSQPGSAKAIQSFFPAPEMSNNKHSFRPRSGLPVISQAAACAQGSTVDYWRVLLP
jgi:hypothetical protein